MMQKYRHLESAIFNLKIPKAPFLSKRAYATKSKWLDNPLKGSEWKMKKLI